MKKIVKFTSIAMLSILSITQTFASQQSNWQVDPAWKEANLLLNDIRPPIIQNECEKWFSNWENTVSIHYIPECLKNRETSDIQITIPDEKMWINLTIEYSGEEYISYKLGNITKKSTNEIIQKLKELNPNITENAKFIFHKKDRKQNWIFYENYNLIIEHEDKKISTINLEDFVYFFDYEIPITLAFKDQELSKEKLSEIEEFIRYRNPDLDEIVVHSDWSATVSKYGITQKIEKRDLVLEISLPKEIRVNDKNNLTIEEKEFIFGEIFRVNEYFGINQEKSGPLGMYFNDEHISTRWAITEWEGKYAEKWYKNTNFEEYYEELKIYFNKDNNYTEKLVTKEKSTNIKNDDLIVLLTLWDVQLYKNTNSVLNIKKDQLNKILVDNQDIENRKNQEKQSSSSSSIWHGGYTPNIPTPNNTLNENLNNFTNTENNIILNSAPDSNTITKTNNSNNFIFDLDDEKTIENSLEKNNSIILNLETENPKTEIISNPTNQNIENNSDDNSEFIQNSKVKLPKILPATGFGSMILVILLSIFTTIYIRKRKSI